jgi:high-affinity iron transporter
MLLTSVILILREVLEAALLFSLLMALSHKLRITYRWVFVSLLTGLLGAAVYGFNIEHVSEWFDGVGQEVVNAFLQITIYCLLCLLAILSIKHSQGKNSAAQLSILMAATVTLATVREGSEIMIYLSGFLQIPNQMASVFAGSVIGAGIGISTGAVFYYALLNLKHQVAKYSGATLLVLVAAGMASQATQLLTQADWLPAQYPLWDSSWLIDEQSITGQLLYALIGYEATPSPLQVIIYIASIILLIALAALFTRNRNTSNGM